MTFDQTLLDTVVEEAKGKAAGSNTWLRAIEKAAEQLHSNPYIHDEGEGLLILSESGKMYKADGSCQCEAHSHGQACWHRAAAKLVKRYKEAVLVAASSYYQAALTDFATGRIHLLALHTIAQAAGISTDAAEADINELRRKQAAAPAAPVATLPVQSTCARLVERIEHTYSGARVRACYLDGWAV